MSVGGNTKGLKHSQWKALDKLSKKRNSSLEIASWDTLKILCGISKELEKVVGVLINRKGNIVLSIVGDSRQVKFPANAKLPNLLNGFRFLRTDFHDLTITDREKSDLHTRELDLIAAVGMNSKGIPTKMSILHPDFNDPEENPPVVLPPVDADKVYFDLKHLFEALGTKSAKSKQMVMKQKNRAFLCAVQLPTTKLLEDDLAELVELAKSLDIEIIETFVQKKHQIDGKYCIGRGKLDEILDQAPNQRITHLLFFQNLSPNQLRLISDLTDCTVMDRTQTILEIFRRRANSHDVRLQVDLAHLKYMLPRLREKDTELSRLVGGIGGQGPGETKLEIFRRRAKDRIAKFEKEIEGLAAKRFSKRSLRKRNNVPVVSIIGYTNAGKSTLLNTLTFSDALVENKPFATLDPFSKRMRFPQEREVILTDTVGFIRNLPKDLMNSFRATIEEIGEADLIIHLVDISYPHFQERIDTVHHILEDLQLEKIPMLLVFNKTDLLPRDDVDAITYNNNAIGISAENPATCKHLIEKIQGLLWDKLS